MTRRTLSSGELQIRFWGVRGSTCASGPQFAEFGSHTPCVEIRCGDRLFIVDAGTALPRGDLIWAKRAGHRRHPVQPPHLDHISGLPSSSRRFSATIASFARSAAILTGRAPRKPSKRLYSPPLFPSASMNCRRISNITASGRRYPVVRGRHQSRNASSQPPGGATGYRFTHAGGSSAISAISSIPTRGPTRRWPPSCAMPT